MNENDRYLRQEFQKNFLDRRNKVIRWRPSVQSEFIHVFIIHLSNNDPIKYDPVKDCITRPRFNITYLILLNALKMKNSAKINE